MQVSGKTTFIQYDLLVSKDPDPELYAAIQKNERHLIELAMQSFLDKELNGQYNHMNYKVAASYHTHYLIKLYVVIDFEMVI